MKKAPYHLPAAPLEEQQLRELIAFYDKSHPSSGISERTLFNFAVKDKYEQQKSFQDYKLGDYYYLKALLKDIPEKQFAKAMQVYHKYQSPNRNHSNLMKPPVETWKLACLWHNYPIEDVESPPFYPIRDAFLATWFTLPKANQAHANKTECWFGI